MVYLALTPQGLQEILDTPETAEAPVWCGANTLSEAEFAKLERSNVTRFTYSLANAEKAQSNVPYGQSKTIIRESASGLKAWYSRTNCAVWVRLLRVGCCHTIKGRDWPKADQLEYAKVTRPMSKRDKHLAKVQEYKDRFRRMSLESLRERANSPSLFKEAAIALRELIAERESAESHQEHRD